MANLIVNSDFFLMLFLFDKSFEFLNNFILRFLFLKTNITLTDLLCKN